MSRIKFTNSSTVVYNCLANAASLFYSTPWGNGGLHAYKLNGVEGDSVEVRGGAVTDSWDEMELICILTIGGERRSACVEHIWPIVEFRGIGTLLILRGNS